jgi:hypothetical protein
MGFVFLETENKVHFHNFSSRTFRFAVDSLEFEKHRTRIFWAHLCSDASRTEHQGRRCLLSRYVKQETSKNTNKEKETKET